MKTRRIICDERICIRLPKRLADTIHKECVRSHTNLSELVRESLVDLLSQRAIDEAVAAIPVPEGVCDPSLRVLR
jgi:hypothetical protein